MKEGTGAGSCIYLQKITFKTGKRNDACNYTFGSS